MAFFVCGRALAAHHARAFLVTLPPQHVDALLPLLPVFAGIGKDRSASSWNGGAHECGLDSMNNTNAVPHTQGASNIINMQRRCL